MLAFIVEGPNRPGEFARTTAAIAARGINLYACCLAFGERGADAYLAQDEAGVRGALNDAGMAFHELPVVTATLEDRPGTAAAAAKRLADAGVNIELFVPVEAKGGRVTVAIGVDNIQEARRALGDQLTPWSVPDGSQRARAGSTAG